MASFKRYSDKLDSIISPQGIQLSDEKINTRCIFCNKDKLPESIDNKSIYNYKDCGHQCFFLALIEYAITSVKHITFFKDDSVLTEQEFSNMIECAERLFKSCPLCPQLENCPQELKQFYYMPPVNGTIIYFEPKLDFERLLESDIELTKPFLFDKTGYRGTGLVVLYQNKKVYDIDTFDYYPNWYLYIPFITPKLIDESNYYQFDDGIIISETIGIKLYNGETELYTPHSSFIQLPEGIEEQDIPNPNYKSIEEFQEILDKLDKGDSTEIVYSEEKIVRFTKIDDNIQVYFVDKVNNIILEMGVN